MPEEYIIPLGIDLTGIVNKIQPVTTGLSNISEAAVKAGQSTKSAFSEVSKAADNVGKSVAASTSVINQQRESTERLRIKMQQFQQTADLATDPKKLVEYNRKVEAIGESIEKLKNAGKKGFDELGNKIDENSKRAGLFQNALAKIATYLSIAFAVRAVINFGKEVLEVTSKIEGVQRAFNRINAPGLLDGLRKATRGTVSDLELMQRAVLANQFDIPIKQLASFYEFASKRARDLGVDTQKFVNDVIAGTARGSVRILDNLGISQAEVRAEFKKTGDFASAVFNVVERTLAKSKEEADTTADKFGRISATITNIEGNVGKSSTGIISTITSLVQSQLDLINDYVIGLDGKLEALGKKFATQDNTKLIASFKDDSAEGRASALKGYDILIAKQEQAVDRYNKKIDDVSKDLNLLQRIGRAAFTDLNDKAENERNAAVVYLSQLKGEKESLLGVADQELQSQRKADAQAELNAGKVAARNAKLIAERKSLNDQLTKLTNDYYSAEIDAIDDVTTKAVASETVQSQNRVRGLEAERANLKERAALYPELAKQYNAVVKQINKDIVQEQAESTARVAVIIKKGDEDQLKLRQQSAKDIADVLKTDSDAQIDAIHERYDKIRTEAKKAGTLTTEIEVKLAKQERKDVEDVTTKQLDESLKKQESIALSAIYTRKKKEGESEKKFERDNQIAILQVQIEFAQARLRLIADDPSKVKEVNELTAAIYKMQNAVKGLKKEGATDLFSALGLNEYKVNKFAKAISTIGQQFADLFNGLAEGANQQIEDINKQIDAIDDKLSADEEAVDKEQDLANQGRANNLSTAQKALEDDRRVKATLQKQEEEAQKKKQALQQAALIADSIAQTSNLITASSEIFESLAGIPFIGVGLAAALIGVMFGAFAVAKVNAFNATKQTAADGGTAGGNLHSEGGNKYVSMDGNDRHVLEIERGEEIIKRSSSAKHRRLLKAINKDDFSSIDMNDISLRQILEGTGIISHIDVATKAGTQNKYLQEKQNIIVVNTNSNNGKTEELLSSINKGISKLKERKREVYDMGTYLWIVEGNTNYRIFKSS